ESLVDDRAYGERFLLGDAGEICRIRERQLQPERLKLRHKIVIRAHFNFWQRDGETRTLSVVQSSKPTIERRAHQLALERRQAIAGPRQEHRKRERAFVVQKFGGLEAFAFVVRRGYDLLHEANALCG